MLTRRPSRVLAGALFVMTGHSYGFILVNGRPIQGMVSSTTSLAASPVTWSAVGHVVGGTLGVPIVSTATKRGSWYRAIDLPPWTPPDWLFGPVWTTLYAMMGIAAGKIYERVGLQSWPIRLWAVHYALNLSWAPVFFGLQRLRLGLWLNFGILGTTLACMRLFYQIDPVCAYLLVPYLAWVSFATVLNWSICARNPTKDGWNEAVHQAKITKMRNEAGRVAGL